MLIATLMAAATVIAAPPAPPAPPEPPPPPAFAGAGDVQVIQTGEGGRSRTLIVAGRGRTDVGARGGTLLTYRAPDGRDVTVVSDRPVTEAEAERLRRETPQRPVIDEARMAAVRAQASEAARTARVEAAQAMHEAAQAREEAREQAAHARDYAALARRELPAGAPPEAYDAEEGARASASADRAELARLRVQMARLRAQMRQMQRELDAASRSVR